MKYLNKEEVYSAIKNFGLLYGINLEDISVFGNANLVLRGVLEGTKKVNILLKKEVYDRLKERPEVDVRLMGKIGIATTMKAEKLVIYREHDLKLPCTLNEKINKCSFSAFTVDAEIALREKSRSAKNPNIIKLLKAHKRQEHKQYEH